MYTCTHASPPPPPHTHTQIIVCVLISSEVLVEFNPSTYVVREREEEVVLMVQKVGGSITNVTVEAITQNGTATGEYDTV